MKKIFMLFGALMLMLNAATAQNCPFRIRTEVTPATCYNNGKVLVIPVDDAGNELTIVPGSLFDENNPGNGLSSIKFCYKNLYSPTDTAEQCQYDPLMVLDTGTYVIHAEVFCFNPTQSGDDRYTVLSDTDTVVITTSYVKPKVNVIEQDALTATGYGTVPTLWCENTGRVQLRIYDGAFPYMIRICNADTVPVDTIYFYGNQYTGTNQSRYDYKEYYSIDSLASGKYFFFVEDGCDYHLPRVWQEVREVQPPKITNINWYAWSGSYADSNIIRTQITVNLPNAYYNKPEYVQFRFIHENINGITDTTPWQYVPGLQEMSTGNNTFTWKDTIHNANGYCDIYGKKITFQARMTACGDEINLTKYHIWNKPTYFYTDSVWVPDYTWPYAAVYDSCGYWGGYDTSFGHMEPIIYFYNGNEYWDRQTDATTSQTGNNYQVTYPIYWVYTDADGDTLKIDTVRNVTHASDSWTSYSSPHSTHPASRLRAEDIYPKYGEITDSLLVIPVTRTLYNAQGCPIYTRTDNIKFRKRWRYTTAARYTQYWYSNYGQSYYDYCCQNERYVYVDGGYLNNIYMDSTIVELYESPLGNKYNFRAVYHLDTHSWTYEKDSISNLARLSFSGYSIIYMYDYCLPSGLYKYRIITKCDTFYTSTQPGFNDTYSWFYDEPEYELTYECTNLTIKPKYKYFYHRTYNNSKYYRHPNGQYYWDVYDSVERVNPRFRIIKNLTGSTTTFNSNYRYLGDSLRVTGAGSYVIEITPSIDFTTSYCTPPVLYDTVTFDGGTVAFKYAYGWACDEHADVGFVRVKAHEGTAPYNYTLYSGPNKTGTILGQNQTGVFDTVPVHAGQVVSCYVEDQCEASFWIDITVWDMEHIKKAWFLDGLQVTDACEGSYVNLYAIGLDESVTYHWTGPDGFETFTNSTRIFLPRSADTGYYKVEILNTGCSNLIASDSVKVNVIPAPRVTILRDTTVCPGEEVEVWYRTEGEGDVHYTIAYDENSAVTESQHTNDDSLTFVAMAQRIFWVKEVEDDRCRYTIPEDTVIINLVSHVASACDVITESDPICRTEDGVAYASSGIGVPYYLKWYRDYEQTELLRIDTINDPSARSSYNFTGLVQDTSIYVTAYNADYCETRYGTVVNWLNMSQGTSSLLCAQSIRFYDDGGLNSNYSPNMDAKRVFITEDGQPITISFEMLNLQPTYDHIYIFNGNTTNTDSMIAHYSGNYTGNLPAPVVSSHDTMTVWFLSNGNTQTAGWVATVSNNPRPAAASIHVFDTVVSTIADASVHIRYDGSAEVTATAAGGRGELYKYVWQTSIDDGATWTSVDTQLLASDTSLLVLEHNTQPTLVRVLVTDASIEACEGVGTAQVALPVAHIKLALEVSVPDVPHCSQDYPVTVTVRNYGQGTADSVWAKVKLPANVDFVNQADSMLFLGDMPGGMVIDTVINVRSYIVQNTASAHPVKAQIWYCVEADSVPTVTYGDWDWNGAPRQIDEDVDTMHVMPFFTLDDYSIVGFDDTVCYLGTAILHASSNQTGTQYIRWFGDRALRNQLKIDTLVAGQFSEYELDSLRTVTTLYVTIESEDLCPAVLAGAVDAKLNASETQIVSMTNGQTYLGLSDKVRFYDAGGSGGNYNNNEDFTHTFITGAGEVALRLNSISIGNAGDVLTIYDGPTASGIPLTQITSSVSSAMIYTSTTGALTLRWHSDGSSVGSGWNADVVNTVNYASSQATAYLYEPLAVTEVTATDDYVCYGDSATVTASTSIAAPQYFTWYDAEFNMLKQDTSNNGTSSLTVYNQTRQNTYYVAVGNEASCPATVPDNSFLNSSVVLMTSSINGRTTLVEPGKRINFYDEGGPDGDYWTTYAYWYHTFSADTGNIVLTFSQFYTESTSWDWIELFDGPSSSSPRIYVNGNYKLGGDLSSQMPLTITSSGNSLTVFWRTDGSFSISGWRATVSNGNAGGSSSIVKDYDIMLDATTNEQVTIVSPEDIYGFYDDGGISGAYSDAAGNFTHTFTATQGVVQADLSNLYLQSSDHLYVYDGPDANDDYLIADLTGRINSQRQFFSTGHSMTFKLFTHGNTNSIYTGWNMNITSNWQEALAEANVNLQAPTQETTITASTADVCFNSPAELTASSDNGIYYIWFASDGKTVLQYDTALDHLSTYNIDHVRYNDHFYIVTTSEGSCPTIVPYQYSDKYLNIGTNGKTTVVGNDDFIRFYDDGGSSANYRSERLDYTHTFKAETGEIYVKMNNHYLQNKDTLWIYDGSSVNPDSILVEWNLATQNSGNAQSFVSKHGSVTFRFKNNSASYNAGWSAYITTSPIEAQTVLLNPLTSGKTTFLSPIDSVLFYDDGGASGYYTPLERTLRHTFTALQGKVRMKFDNSNNLCSNDHFYIYDGPVGTGTFLGDFTGSQLNNREFVSTGNQLGVQVSTINNSSACSGWNATVTTVYDLPQARADVTIHSPADKTDLITTGDYVCYGETAQVMARSPKLVYPQYYTWYDASMNELMRDTLYEYGSSRYTIPNLTYDTFYLVSTQYATECPAVLPINKAEIRAYPGNGSQTTMVGDNDYYHFFDSGGQSGIYSSDPGDYVHTFTSANNAHLYLTFSTPAHYFQTNDTLYLYDGPVADDAHLIERYTSNLGSNGPFISESSSFTFKFAKHGVSYANGWHAIISEGEVLHVSTLLLDQSNNNKTTVLLPSDSIRFYDDGGSASSYANRQETLVHTFKAMQGEVRLTFEGNVNTYNYDTLYVYRGSTVDPANLIDKYRPNAFTNRSFQDTALTVRFRKSGSSNNNGWTASVVNVLNSVVDTAHVGIHQPLADVYVAATNDIVCYDATASLFACSEIAYPQYYTWYDKNMTEVLLVDTVRSGCSEFDPAHQISDSLYYVTIYNDTTCPFIPEVHITPCSRELTDNFIYNASKNNGVTVVADNDSIPFYDDGGPSANYIEYTYAEWYHTFTTDTGHVVLNLTSFMSEQCCDYMRVYDGPTASGSYTELKGELTSITASNPRVITSTGNSLTVHWHTDGSVVRSGWEGYIYNTATLKCLEVASATVHIKDANGGKYVTATNDEVCYDETAALTASSSISYPQYYTWYMSDSVTVLQRDTIANASEVASFNPDHQIRDSLYFVSIYNDTTCPYIPELHIHGCSKTEADEFLFNSSKSSRTTTLTVQDSIPFYDEGGPDGSYSTSANYWYHTFTADSGHVVLKLNSFNTANSNDYLAVYDGTSASGTLLGGSLLYGNLNSSMPRTLISSGKSLTVKWYRNSGYSGYPGWEGYVYTDVAPTCIELAPAAVKVNPNPVVQLNTLDEFCPSVGTVELTARITTPTITNYTYSLRGELVPTSSSMAADQLSDTFMLAIPSTYCNNVYRDTVVVADGNGCTARAVTEIKVKDTTKPIISVVTNSNPDGACNPTITAPTFKVNDNCEGELALPSDSVTTTGKTGTGCEKSQTWTAHYTDPCGNKAENVSVTYTWTEDTENPVISVVTNSNPAGVCNPTIVAPTFKVNDNCVGELALPSDSVTTTGKTGTGCEKSQTWTAHYTDPCGNKAENVSVTYTWTEDATKPVISVLTNSNPDGACNPTITAPTFKVNDNCVGELALPSDSVTTTGKTGTGCEKSQTWTAHYTDPCGNKAENVSVTYTWTEDTENPVISVVTNSNPSGVCNPTIVAPTFKVNDNCVGELALPSDSVTTTGKTGTGCEKSQTWTAHYTDPCGNKAENVSVTYTWTEDATKPVISVVTNSNPDGACNPTITAPTFKVNDNCAGEFALPIDSITDGGVVNTSACGRSQTWTAHYTDPCDNKAADVSVTYTWTEDHTVPELHTEAVSDHKGCNPTIVAPTFTVTDNCEGTFVLSADSVTTTGKTGTGCEKSQSWTAHYTDGCGNPAAPLTVTYYWKEDTQKPVIATTATDSHLGCDPTTIIPPTFTVSDNCEGDFALPTDSVTDGGVVAVTGEPHKFSRTWTAHFTDLCGNKADNVSITYTWVEAPTVTISCPPDVRDTLAFGDCVMNIYPAEIGTPTVNAPADWPMTVSNDIPADNLYSEGETIITWTATDDICGYSVSCEQKVIVVFPQCPDAVDCEGNVYHGVRIDCDCWTQTNLQSNYYGNPGVCEEEIPCNYLYDANSAAQYGIDILNDDFGRLYCPEAGLKDSVVNSHGHIRGICPEGWYLPTPEKYEALNLHGAEALKSPLYWTDGGGNNSTEFTWLPAGWWNGALQRFEGLTSEGYFLSTEIVGGEIKTHVHVVVHDCDVIKEVEVNTGYGYSVRCIKEKD